MNINNIIKKSGLSSKKLLLIGILVIIIIIIFIILNALEYNTGYINFYNSKNNIYTKEYFSTTSINNVFFNNNITSMPNTNNTIYLEGVNEDILIDKIEFTSSYMLSSDNMPSIIILENNNFRLVKKIQLNYEDIIEPKNTTTTATTITYIVKINKNIDLMPRKSYLLILELDKTNIHNNPEIMFIVGDPRFRINGKIIYDINSNFNDNITLQQYNKDNNTLSILPDEINLEQFNKITLIINKPNMDNIKSAFSSSILSNKVNDHAYIMKELDKYTPIKFDITLKDITQTDLDNGIKPSFKLPNSLTFCNNELTGSSEFMKNGCILQLFNLLPNHTYNLKVKIIYAQSDNFNNIRESNELSQNLTISTSNTNDILSTAMISSNKINLTRDLIKFYNESINFNEYQDKQNIKLSSIESNIKNTMELYKL